MKSDKKVAKPAGKAAGGKAAERRPAAKPIRVAFPKKSQVPAVAEFAARLPLGAGRRFDGVRGFLLKNKGVTEDVFFYGPKSGWALRYLKDERPLCSLLILDERPLGIVSLDPAAAGAVDWAGLSDVARQARKAAHGSPSLLWVDLPLDGSGATDFKALVKAKLGKMPATHP